eukprot:TRINITY_DN42210_c0_g1_i1.p1 TRINITY_DN42210_c0_g1~~TRINITY_DN42210_c0_g1_i1.p1  ORF type:complete len:472 (+),score=74.41 TRINITY_DN42210_c0_g1_i1:41-1417(+)
MVAGAVNAGIPPLHASLQSVDTILTVDYWRSVCPSLHVADDAFIAGAAAAKEAPASCLHSDQVRKRLVDEGFASLPSESLTWSVNVATLAAAALELDRLGWPATFLAIYDEVWIMAGDAARLMERATGNSMCMDIVGFLVDPRNTKGFSPHRDRQPEDWMLHGVPESTAATFKEDGMAKYVTIWAALTDAHPDNSCLHFVPKSSDPGYSAGDPEDVDPLKRCFEESVKYQDIRCVPVNAGGCVFHTHRTIHWGNRGRVTYDGPARIALSFGFSSPDFEPPYFKPKHLPFPPLDLRLALASAQVLNYSTLSNTDREGWIALAGTTAHACSNAGQLALFHRLFQKRAKAFDPVYRKMISTKFVSVSLGSPSLPAATSGTGGNASTDDAARKRRQEEDDEDEDALEAMLNVEAKSKEILFHDDFDMLNSGEDEASLRPVGGKPKMKRRPREIAKRRKQSRS